MKSYWREKATPIITKVIADNKGKDLKEIRKALHNAYPFGPRQYHPHKIWLDECARQLGIKKQTHRHLGRKKKIEPVDPNQMNLF